MKKSMEIMTQNIYLNMNNVFLDEEEQNLISKIEDKQMNEDYFTAALIAFKIQFEALTGQEMDLIDFTHLLNRLAIQFIMEKDE